MLSRCMLIAAAFAAGPAMGQVFFSEDFEGLALGPNVEETRPNSANPNGRVPLGTPNLWTSTPPEGWLVDNAGVPGFGGTFDPETNAEVRPRDGIAEWEGWTFVQKDFFTLEGQGREFFSKGQNVVAVADPDEFDDTPVPAIASGRPGIGGQGAPTYNTILTTPFADFTGLPAAVPGAKLAIKFDSSFRGEEFTDEGDDHQTAVVTASFGFGSEVVQVLRWAPNEINPFTGVADPGFTGFALEADGITQYIPIQRGNSVPDARGRSNPFIDQTFVALIDIPAGLEGGLENVSLSFGMETARNDWWWAIDNVQLSIVPEPTSAVIALVGLAGFAARRR